MKPCGICTYFEAFENEGTRELFNHSFDGFCRCPVPKWAQSAPRVAPYAPVSADNTEPCRTFLRRSEPEDPPKV